MSKIINIFGINIDNYTKSELSKKLRNFLSAGKQCLVVTPNPELILRAGKDEEFFYILNHANLRIPDGSGLWFAGIALFKFIHRTTGVWLTEFLLKNVSDEAKILIFNWDRGLQKKDELKLKLGQKYPNIEFLILDIKKARADIDWAEVNKFKPSVVFCTLGAPYQEKFLFHNLRNMPSVRVAAAIGGTFDFLTGKVKRAPKIMRISFIEWAWRVLKQSGAKTRRLKRIYKAAIIFPIKFCRWRFVMPFQYRPCVSCLLYKKENNKYKIFIVERQDDPGHWQLPQGGLDGLTLKEAGLKELREEAGNNKIVFKREYPDLHKYEFPLDPPRHRGARYTKHTGYKGQKQGLIIVKFTGEDKDIKISYWDHTAWQWIDPADIVNTVHKHRQEAMRKYLEKFKQFINNK